MKKLILAACLLSTSSVFADSCTFNLNFTSVWQGFTNWTVIVTDISSDQTPEAVGGTQLYNGPYPVSTNKLQITVNNCSNSTQLGFFAHAPSSQNDDSQLKVNAYQINFLDGMSFCVGDMGSIDPTNIELQVETAGASPYQPNTIQFGKSGQYNLWTKDDFAVTCKTPGPLFPTQKRIS